MCYNFPLKHCIIFRPPFLQSQRCLIFMKLFLSLWVFLHSSLLVERTRNCITCWIDDDFSIHRLPWNSKIGCYRSENETELYSWILKIVYPILSKKSILGFSLGTSRSSTRQTRRRDLQNVKGYMKWKNRFRGNPLMWKNFWSHKDCLYSCRVS